MGTSTTNYGQNGRTPLVPSWLDGDDATPNDLPPQADPERFKTSRGNFTRYINSGGRNIGNLRRASSDYVRNSTGGSTNATSRLGSARSSTAKVVSLFNSISRNGLNNALEEFHLGELSGKSAKDFFLGIIDFVCPDGGVTDEGIARSSFVETIVDMPEIMDRGIEEMSEGEMFVFVKRYMTNIIQQRLINDIGRKLISLPGDIATVEVLQTQIKDYILGSVSDAMTKINVQISKIKSNNVSRIVDSVYKETYEIMASLEE